MNKLKQNQILGNIFSFGSVTLLSSIFSFIVGVVTRNLLGPEIYGYWLTISMIFPFIGLLQFGTLNAMNREVPYYLARKDAKKVEEIRGLTFSFMLTVPLICMVVLFASSIFILFFNIATEYKIGLFATTFIGALSFLSGYIEMYYKSNQEFKVASRLIFIKSISQSVLTLIFVYMLGYTGLYIGMTISLVLEVIFGRESFRHVKFEFNKEKYKELIKIGFPILLVGLVWSLMIASDRLIISLFMNPVDMGNYGVGILVFSTLMLFPQVIGQVFYPKIVALVSKNDYDEIMRLSWKVNKIIAILLGLVVLIGYFILPFLIKWLMPEYVDGIKSAQILTIGIYPLTLVSFAANYFNSTHNQKTYMFIQIVAIIVNIILCLLFLIYSKSIVSVAVGTSLANLVYCILMNNFFFKKLKMNIKVSY